MLADRQTQHVWESVWNVLTMGRVKGTILFACSETLFQLLRNSLQLFQHSLDVLPKYKPSKLNQISLLAKVRDNLGRRVWWISLVSWKHIGLKMKFLGFFFPPLHHFPVLKYLWALGRLRKGYPNPASIYHSWKCCKDSPLGKKQKSGCWLTLLFLLRLVVLIFAFQ